MRLILAASLALAPALLHAQAVKPTLVAANSAPRAVESVDAPAPRRITTGLTAPKLLHTAAIVPFSATSPRPSAGEQVTVHMTVSPEGIPTDVKVTSATEATFARQVVEAVQKYRYQPGVLDGAPVAVPLTLKMTVNPAGI